MDFSAWLLGLGMQQYELAFRNNHIDAELLPTLTDADLRDLGIVSLGHRKRLLAAIAARATTEQPQTPDVFAGLTVERRQITVLFCDLVGSTPLSTQLDPEELRRVLVAYQEAVSAAIRAARGYVAHLIGDGVLAYFGWPAPDEAHAETAVRAALAVLETLVPQQRAVRIGIATGLVVVGDLIGSGSAEEAAVIGKTPNLAARLQALAEPDQIVVCATTAAQLGGLFELDDLGWTDLKGFDQAQRAWRVLEATMLASRSEALPVGTLTPLIGRDDELELLCHRWERAKSGKGQVVLLSGEAGIGKSRLLAAFEERLGGEPHVSLRLFCSAHRQDIPLHPIISRWQQAAGFARGDSAEAKLAKLEAVIAGEGLSLEDVALLAAMLSVPTGARYPSLDLSPQRLRERTFALLIRRVTAQARRQPVLMLLEDVHWADASSLELFDRGIDHLVDVPVLHLISFRPEFAAPWVGRPHATVLALNRLDRHRSAELVGRVTAEHPLSPELVERIVIQTDGMPLFIEEVTKVVLESATRRSDTSLPLAVPATLQASLMARLDRLPAAKRVAQTGAVIGREFSHRLLREVGSMPDPLLTQGLEELITSGLAFRRGVTPDVVYVFKHALVCDVAYECLLREQRSEIHRRVISVIEADASLEPMEPALLGYHCAQAGLIAKAAHHYRIAGEQSVARSALVETKIQLERGLRFAESLANGPDSDKLKAELLLALGGLILIMYGLASKEAASVFERATDLGRKLDDPQVFARALWARGAIVTNRAELQTDASIGAELLSAGQKHDDIRAITLGSAIIGAHACLRGDFRLARQHHETALARANARFEPLIVHPTTPEVMMAGYLIRSLAALGFVDKAKAQAEIAVSAARLQSRLQLAFMLNPSMLAMFLLQDYEQLKHDAELQQSLSEELGLPYLLALSRCVLGWLSKHCDPEAALEMMLSSNETLRGLGVELHREWAESGLVSDVLSVMGRQAEAIAVLDAGLAFSKRTGVMWFDAELHRRKGELLVVNSEADRIDAENEFRRALNIARNQSAKLFELRAATSLASLWGGQGRRSEARDLLKPIYAWFTEGLGSVGLQEAKNVLDAVS